MGQVQRRTEVSVYDCQGDDCLDIINGRAQVDVITVPGTPTKVEGDVPHDDPDTSDLNPVKLGHKAIAHGTNPTAVAANDRTNWYSNRHGIPWVIGGHPNIQTARKNYTAAQTDVKVITVSAGTKIVLTKCSVLLDRDSTATAVAVRLGFAAAATPTDAGVVLAHPGLAPGSGVVEGSGAGIIGIGADGDDLHITSEVPTGGSIDVVAVYYTIEG